MRPGLVLRNLSAPVSRFPFCPSQWNLPALVAHQLPSEANGDRLV